MTWLPGTYKVQALHWAWDKPRELSVVRRPLTVQNTYHKENQESLSSNGLIPGYHKESLALSALVTASDSALIFKNYLVPFQAYESANSGESIPATGLAKLAKEDVEAELELLTSYEKKFKESNGDLGPIYDIVLFHDGDTW